jgi:hypothetical protein
MAPEPEKVPAARVPTSSVPGSSSPASTRTVTRGRIVDYRVAEKDTELQSNGIHAGDVLPAIVTRAWKNDAGQVTGVNLKVFVDGPHNGWVTSVQEGTADGTWSWPVIA